MFRGKGWFSGGLWKPKNPHSLEHLKYLYHLLSKNQIVTDQNKGLLVETLRSIAEILIWGDQNDSTVFDFFLEKNMLSYFLKIMKQKCGRYVCVQLLQTLNILFENIRNETSLYYLLSNNHVNSIIVHKFDFSDEEVMAYYISFLKTLSLKLNNHTIHFFYNEHTNDFPLYTEAIKFFNHSESMVRIAVRTLTLNVFKAVIDLTNCQQRVALPVTMRSCDVLHPISLGRSVTVEDKAMLKFIRDKTAAPYFSNLVWFIGNHVLELDSCVTNADHQSQTRLADLVAEHLDHLHYLNDILCLQIEALNDVLTDHLLNRLFIPLYVYSLTKHRKSSQGEVRQPEERPHVSSVVSLFLLSQVFLIISHKPLVRQLAHIILNRDMKIFGSRNKDDSSSNKSDLGSEPEFVAPEETLEQSLETTIRNYIVTSSSTDFGIAAEELNSVAEPVEEKGCKGDPENQVIINDEGKEKMVFHGTDHMESAKTHVEEGGEAPVYEAEGVNITDEEKVVAAQRLSYVTLEQLQQEFSLSERPFLEAIFMSLDCTENDHSALFGSCLLYALGHNPGINQDLLDTVLMPTEKSETKHWYNVNLVERLIKLINLSCQYGSKVRLATLQMAILLLKQLVVKDGLSFLQDRHLAGIEQAREESTLLLRNFYKSEEIFLDMFEDEYLEMMKKPLNVEYLMMDANLLLPPAGTPMSGVEFHKRLPCGEVERARRAIRVFFLLRDLSLTLTTEPETQLPLTNLANCIKVNEVLDLNNSDLIACTVVTKDVQKIRRFMVIDVLQLILVEPDTKRLGWGVAKFVGFLQDIEVTGDKDDSRCLHITVHRPSAAASASQSRSPLLAARFLFDDHIRCMAAKQRLTKGRMKARQRKMHQIARLLDLPEHIQPCPSPLRHTLTAVRNSDSSTGIMHRSQSQDTGLRGRVGSSNSSHLPYRPLFTASSKVPGFAAATQASSSSSRHEHHGSAGESEHRHHHHRSGSSPAARGRSASRSRESSPRQRTGSSSEEIPLEDLSRKSSRHNSPIMHRHSISSLPQVRLSSASGTPRSSPVRHHSSRSNKEQAKTHTHSPKTLRPPDTPPVSLVLPEESSTDASFEVPRLIPPTCAVHQTDGSADNPEAIAEDAESPSRHCRKPCCMSETSFSEAQEATEKQHDCAAKNGEVPSSDDPATVLDDKTNGEKLQVSPKVKGAIHTV